MLRRGKLKGPERPPPPFPPRALVYMSRDSARSSSPIKSLVNHTFTPLKPQHKDSYSRRTTNPRVIVMSSSGTSSDPFVSPLWDTWGPEERITLNCLRDMSDSKDDPACRWYLHYCSTARDVLVL
jgi:hypothetical protein